MFGNQRGVNGKSAKKIKNQSRRAIMFNFEKDGLIS